MEKDTQGGFISDVGESDMNGEVKVHLRNLDEQVGLRKSIGVIQRGDLLVMDGNRVRKATQKEIDVGEIFVEIVGWAMTSNTVENCLSVWKEVEA